MDKRNSNLISLIVNFNLTEMAENRDESLRQQSNDQLRRTIERDARYVSQVKSSSVQNSVEGCATATQFRVVSSWKEPRAEASLSSALSVWSEPYLN